MKRIGLFWLLMLACLCGLPAQDVSSQLEAAQAAYEAGDFATAVNTYEALAGEGYHDFALYYNLGNAYYRLGAVGPTLLNYERARLLRPADADLLHNLDLAYARTVDQFEPNPEVPFLRSIRSAALAVGPGGWAAISVVCFLLALTSGVFFVLGGSPDHRKLTLAGAVFGVILSGLFLIMGLQVQAWMNGKGEAIVFQPSLTVRHEPRTAAEEAFILHEGAKVVCLEAANGWVRILWEQDLNGWVPESAIERI